MTVKEWMTRIDKEEMPKKLYDFLAKDTEKLIAEIDIMEVAKAAGKKATIEFYGLRGC
ncbi:hypothetical protein JHJ32_21920 [Parapedobacter sp. ISTM3]|uniref:hypothetical protein n=1 Tax=Parapedobacter sp. ISTM3 TaxID=2800130 RepID=UPI0019068C35|nr:hypothetical protein [Parapedobacter sp. ISTM3]MBK1442673.1 hypothetical protein [Parapedobacter sp. ISTM3]